MEEDGQNTNEKLRHRLRLLLGWFGQEFELIVPCTYEGLLLGCFKTLSAEVHDEDS